MAIPDFQSMMRPILLVLAGSGATSNADLYAAIADHLQLSPEESLGGR